jgi:glycosyltransferase involved in cell wall biosynthesis
MLSQPPNMPPFAPEKITPLVLSFNEAPNIGRTLKQLRWAQDIVVVDSFSDDATVAIAKSFPQVRVFQRKYDNHCGQWNFGLKETGISTEWVLALDADFVLSAELIDEIGSLELSSSARGYSAPFRYCIKGRTLRSGLLRPQTVLYRRSFASYVQDGHTQSLIIEGTVEPLRFPILHDDRKPLQRWFESQQRYMALEAKKLLDAEATQLSKADRIRRLRLVAPLAVLFYCLIVRGGVLDGWPGFYYAFQRMFAELLLSLYLIEHDFNAAAEPKRLIEKPPLGEELAVSGKQQ